MAQGTISSYISDHCAEAVSHAIATHLSSATQLRVGCEMTMNILVCGIGHHVDGFISLLSMIVDNIHSSYVCFYVFDKHEDNIKRLNGLVFEDNKFCVIGICTDILFDVDVTGPDIIPAQVAPTTQFCAVMTFCRGMSSYLLCKSRSDDFSLQPKGFFNCSALCFQAE